MKKIDPEVFLIGFKAEYAISDEELIDRAYKRMKGAGMDLIVANDVAREKTGFGTDTNEVFIIAPEHRVTHLNLQPKIEIAKRILDEITFRDS